MSTPAAKRRRIDTASQTLSKPFRSPFKTPLKKGTSGPSTTSKTIQRTQFNSGIKKPHQQQQKRNISNDDPDIAPLLKQQRELEKELRAVKQEMEVVEQASKIEGKCVQQNGEDVVIDAELKELVAKWTAASRQAAEEMFAQVRDRVNRMGGPRAWKEMQKRQAEFRQGWDREDVPERGGDDDQDDDEREKRDAYAEYGVDGDVETENEKAARGVVDTSEDPGQEDEFTMAMMLRTLNVDLKSIGYDREEQRWID